MKEDKNKRKNLVMLVIGVFVLLLIVIGATYAFFQAQIGTKKDIDVSAITGTTDNLTFSTKDIEAGFGNEHIIDEDKVVEGVDLTPITITANEGNFGESGTSLGDGVEAKATLRANNTNNEATATYNVFFVLSNNDLIHTNGEAPELILKVTGPDGEVEQIEGLNYHTANTKEEPNDVSGFDITGRTTGFAIKRNQEIKVEATNESHVTEQTWKVEVILVNLKSDQKDNAGKTITGQVVITTGEQETYKIAQVSTVYAEAKTYNSITAKVNTIDGTKAIKKYYFAIEETEDEAGEISLMSTVEKEGRTYHESEESTYEFTKTEDGETLKENQSYRIYSYVVDEEGIESKVTDDVIKTDVYKKAIIQTIDKEMTSTSIKVNVKATEDGDGKITKYQFRKDDEESWSSEQEEGTFTFTGLTPEQEYTIHIIGKDSNGKYSQEYTERITTKGLVITIEAKKVDGASETTYDESWTNKKVKFEVTSESEEGQTYQYSTNQTSWNDFTDSITVETQQQATYYFRTTKEGHTKDTEGYQVKIDTTPPSITADVTTKLSSSDTKDITVNKMTITDEGESSWTGTYTVQYRKQSETDDQYKTLGSDYNASTSKLVFPEDADYVIKIIAYDNAGNMNFTTKNISSSCFAAGTKVLTEYGYKNIEDIKVGDLVWSISETTGEKELKRVLNTIISETTELYEIKVGDEIIKATPRHQFYVMDKGWVRAYELTEGDYLVSETNTLRQRIEKIKYTKLEEPIKVYNLTIEDNHNYLVSGHELLVHNTSVAGGAVSPA